MHLMVISIGKHHEKNKKQETRNKKQGTGSKKKQRTTIYDKH
jgi:hypothetical protein